MRPPDRIDESERPDDDGKRVLHDLELLEYLRRTARARSEGADEAPRDPDRCASER